MADSLTSTPPQVSAALSPRRRWWAVARTSPFWMVVIALALRFGWMLAALQKMTPWVAALRLLMCGSVKQSTGLQ